MGDQPNKKLTIFLPTLMGGGAEKVMVTLANEFVERGIGVDLVLAKAQGPYLSQIDQRIMIVDLKSNKQIFCLLGLLKYLRKERPSVMLSALSTANIIAVLARLLSRISFRLAWDTHYAIMLGGKRFGSWVNHSVMLGWLSRRY